MCVFLCKGVIHHIASHRIASHRIASHRIASHRITSNRITVDGTPPTKNGIRSPSVPPSQIDPRHSTAAMNKRRVVLRGVIFKTAISVACVAARTGPPVAFVRQTPTGEQIEDEEFLRSFREEVLQIRTQIEQESQRALQRIMDEVLEARREQSLQQISTTVDGLSSTSESALGLEPNDNVRNPLETSGTNTYHRDNNEEDSPNVHVRQGDNDLEEADALLGNPPLSVDDTVQEEKEDANKSSILDQKAGDDGHAEDESVENDGKVPVTIEKEETFRHADAGHNLEKDRLEEIPQSIDKDLTTKPKKKRKAKKKRKKKKKTKKKSPSSKKEESDTNVLDKVSLTSEQELENRKATDLSAGSERQSEAGISAPSGTQQLSLSGSWKPKLFRLAAVALLYGMVMLVLFVIEKF